jgi:hypothetical protein
VGLKQTPETPGNSNFELKMDRGLAGETPDEDIVEEEL